MYQGQFARMGPDSVIASTTSIVINGDFIRVTGTTSIATISPAVGLQHPSIIVIVPTDGSVNLVTTGNIAVAVTTAQNRATLLAWSPVTAKWYPGAIS